MIAVLVLIAATIGGALATYFVDDRSRVYYRLAAGACIGNTVLGLVGYILAASIGGWREGWPWTSSMPFAAACATCGEGGRVCGCASRCSWRRSCCCARSS